MSTTNKPASTSVFVVTLLLAAVVFTTVTWSSGQAWAGLLIMAASVGLGIALAKRSIVPPASYVTVSAMVVIAVTAFLLSPIYMALAITAIAMIFSRVAGLGRSICRIIVGDEDRVTYSHITIAMTFAMIVTAIIPLIERLGGHGGDGSAITTAHYIAVSLVYDAARRLSKMDAEAAD